MLSGRQVIGVPGLHRAGSSSPAIRRKAGMWMLTRVAAQELAEHNIAVSSSPGASAH
ncbi:MAG: hypothetical protein R2748_17765 [Bryobacterales bacterium]